MKKSIAFLCFSVFMVGAVYAQIKTIYYNSTWQEVSKSAYYQYYREVFKTDSGYLVKDKYRDGNLQMEGLYSDKKLKVKNGYFTYYSQFNGKSYEGRYEKGNNVGQWKEYSDRGLLSFVKNYDTDGKLDGPYISYFDNGVVNYRASYTHGKVASDTVIYFDSLGFATDTALYNAAGNRYGKARIYYTGGGNILSAIVTYNEDQLDDTCFYYYRNGKLSTWELYNEGKLEKNQCFDMNGNPIGCPDKVYNPPTVDDEKSVGDYLQQKIIYPKKAKEDGAEGSVKFSFQIDTLGNVHDLIIIEAVHPSFKKQIEKVVGSMDRLTPAIYHNRKVNEYKLFTYTFRLN